LSPNFFRDIYERERADFGLCPELVCEVDIYELSDEVSKFGAGYVHAVFGFLGALLSGRGCLRYRLFSLGGGEVIVVSTVKFSWDDGESGG
jgi:hypothetical protein